MPKISQYPADGTLALTDYVLGNNASIPQTERIPLQDIANLFFASFTDYSSLSTVVGWTSFTAKYIKTLQVGKVVFVLYDISGTSNSNIISFTVPVAQKPLDGVSVGPETVTGFNVDNSSIVSTPARVYIDNKTINVIKSMGTVDWTTSGTKTIRGQFFYETA